MKIDVEVRSPVARTARVKQLGALFDVPLPEESHIEWHGEIPLEAEPWNVGLIVGPSGCGKTALLRSIFGEPVKYEWTAGAVVDDFPKAYKMGEIADACKSVGFNTIPAWMRPYAVLSNGEKFRVELARALIEPGDPIVVDEFTSVVDRQVAKIGAHAVQKFIRRANRRFVAASCHYDVVDWLQPDWILEPATMTFQRRSLRRRPSLEIAIRRVPYSLWPIFAPYHYLTNHLHRAAWCFGLFVRDGEIERIAAFAGVLTRPHPKVSGIVGISRVVTLPDWQGLGLGPILVDQLAAAYRAIGKQLRNYPSHPAFVRVYDASPLWTMERDSGKPPTRSTPKSSETATGRFGGRPNAVFAYCGPAMEDVEAARALIEAVP